MRVTAANWSQLAEQARAMVDDMDDALAKKTLLEIAAGYDRLTARGTCQTAGPGRTAATKPQQRMWLRLSITCGISLIQLIGSGDSRFWRATALGKPAPLVFGSIASAGR
jgi:hypothetical protein